MSSDDPHASTPADSQDPRALRVERLVRRVIHQRLHGEPVNDAQLIAEHSDLAPELAQALARLEHIERARAAATFKNAPQNTPDPPPELDVPDGDPLDDLTFSDTGDEPQITVEAPGYRISRRTDPDAVGQNYTALQQSTGRRVALRVMPAEWFASDDDRLRFARQVQTLAVLEHPHIVGVLDCGRTAAGEPFVVTPVVDGVTLDAWLEERPKLPDQLRLLMRLCDAVNAGHLRGVAHGSLSPASILVDRRGEPHLLNFGLRTSLGAHLHIRDDVQALGRMLESMLQHIPPAQRDARLDAIVRKALHEHKEPGYHTAGELSRDMADFLSGRPTHAGRSGAGAAWLIAAGAAVLLAAAAALAWMLCH